MPIRFKTLTLCLFALGLSGQALAKPVLIKSEHQIEEYQLENGFRVVLAPNPKETTVYMNTIYFTGALNDPEGKGGLAHLLEHLAFKGTKNIPGDEYQRRLDQFTLGSNASTDFRSTRYLNTLRPDAKSIDAVIELEAERMDKLVLQEKHVPTEIDIVKREREVRMDQPFSVLLDQVLKAAYGNTSLGREPIGDLKDLQSINMQELNKFYKDWYMPNNAVMVVSGKFDKNQVLKSVDKHFSPLQKREVPAQAKVPVLDGSKIQQREFHVKKGSNYFAVHSYMNQSNPKVTPTLNMLPTLYGLAPSGLLYKNMVETGQAIGVDAGAWTDPDMGVVFMIGVYSPQHDVNQVKRGLIAGAEAEKNFSEAEVKRAQSILANQADTIKSSSAGLGEQLANYIVESSGQWSNYFVDLNRVKALMPTDVNQHLASVFKPEYRLQGLIEPTPEDEKKAVERTATETKASTEQVAEEPLKEVGAYQKEIKDFVKQSKTLLKAHEKKVQRGQLDQGIQYAFFNITTKDDKTYARIQLNFADGTSLKNKAAILDLMTYLTLRGSEQYNLQAITDKSIETQGAASISRQSNTLTINIHAKKEHFVDYLNYMLEVIRTPSFDQTEFDLAVKQTLAGLDRPYSEPNTVASLTLARMLEQYEPDDIRYHFEPELAKKQYASIERDAVLDAYKTYISADHATVAITGEFDSTTAKQTLKQHLANWKTGLPFTRVDTPFVAFKATKEHVLAEQREFGFYNSVMTIPVGGEHKDALALQVFAHILADSQLSSRLGLMLREKNALVYGFNGDITQNIRLDNSALTISANYSAGGSDEVSQTVHQVLTEMRENGVTEQELEAAKSEILKRRVSNLEDERRVNGLFAYQLEKGRNLLDRMKRDKEIAKLTKKDVDAAIQKYIHLDQLVEVMADQYGKPTALHTGK